MRLEIQIENVVAVRSSCYFIALQIDYHDQLTPTLKLRTDMAPPSDRPKFTRNLFALSTLVELQTLKFGLMGAADTAQSSIKRAELVGVGSLRLSLKSLRQLPSQGKSKLLLFLNKDHQVGQFSCKIRFHQSKAADSLSQGSAAQRDSDQPDPMLFNPLLSRVLYTAQASKDSLRTQNNIQLLQKLSQQLFSDFKTAKAEQQTLERIFWGLQKDQQQLRSEIELSQKLNQKISSKIAQKEQLEPLTLEIEMLKNTEEGRKLLLEKLEYFESRIELEQLEHDRLALKYQRTKHHLEAKIKSAEHYAEKLRGKELQLFQLHRNAQILRRFEDVEYQFSCNQHIIASLAKQIPRSELNAAQAALLLSQVNFHLHLQHINANQGPNEKIISLIEKQADQIPLSASQESEEQRLVLGIKLSALEEEVASVRAKLRAVAGRREIQESTVKRI